MDNEITLHWAAEFAQSVLAELMDHTDMAPSMRTQAAHAVDHLETALDAVQSEEAQALKSYANDCAKNPALCTIDAAFSYAWRAAIATKQAEAATASNERELEQALKERDDVEDMADQLAAQIAAITGADIGEHTSANDPWRNAMLAADEWIAEDLRRMFDGRPEQPRPPAGSLAAQAIWLADNAPPSTSKELIESWQVNTVETLRQCAAALATQQEAQPQADPLHLSRILHELAGAASMCWEPRPTGVFDSQKAIEFVAAAIAEIRARAAQQATGERT